MQQILTFKTDKLKFERVSFFQKSIQIHILAWLKLIDNFVHGCNDNAAINTTITKHLCSLELLSSHIQKQKEQVSTKLADD